MNNYTSILDCIDEINDVVVATEYSVATAMVHSYLKTNKLFAECYERGKDPCDIYQEASIMDEVKDKAKNDKNGFATFFKFVPRLIIAIINKIKNKLLNKNTGDISVKASTVEKVNKELSKKKTGTMMLAGGLVLAAGATGGILIYKKRPNGKSNQKEDHGVKVEVTKDAKVKTNVDVEAMQKDVIGLMQELNNLTHRVTDDEEVIVKLREDMARVVIDKTKALKAEIAEIKNNQAVYELNGNFNQNNQEIANKLVNLEKEISQVKGDLEGQQGSLALKIAEVLSAGPEAINEAMQALIEIAEEVEVLKKQGATESGSGSSSQETSKGNKDQTKEENKNNTDEDENCKTVLEGIEFIKEKISKHKLVEILLKHDYEGILKKIDSVKKKFIDSECSLDDVEDDVVHELHDVIAKYIYGSFPKVNDTKRELLVRFLYDIGYEEVNVKIGDDLKPNAIYFDEAIPNKDSSIPESAKGKIARIERMPYVWNNNFIEKMFGPVDDGYILAGICIFNKL